MVGDMRVSMSRFLLVETAFASTTSLCIVLFEVIGHVGLGLDCPEIFDASVARSDHAAE